MSIKEIAWLAGLLEGEGCFGTIKHTEYIKKYPIVRLAMTDRDIVEKAANLLKVNLLGPYKRQSQNGEIWKSCWAMNICGNRAAGIMMTVLPLMGERRSLKIREILSLWADDRRRCVKCGLLVGPKKYRCNECRIIYRREYNKALHSPMVKSGRKRKRL